MPAFFILITFEADFEFFKLFWVWQLNSTAHQVRNDHSISRIFKEIERPVASLKLSSFRWVWWSTDDREGSEFFIKYFFTAEVHVKWTAQYNVIWAIWYAPYRLWPIYHGTILRYDKGYKLNEISWESQELLPLPCSIAIASK